MPVPAYKKPVGSLLCCAAGAVLALVGTASLLLGLLLIIAALGTTAGYVAGAIFTVMGVVSIIVGTAVFRRGRKAGETF